MGSPFAPSLANLFMAQLERRFILSDQMNPLFTKIVFFYRFIDDCFCVLSDASILDGFLDWLNTIHSSIKFTMEGSRKEVHFLDTIVYKDETNKLAVRPFVKPTDKNNYLHFKSFHKHQLKENIPYGQLLRIKRNSTHHRDYLFHSERLKGQLLQ